jgi:hypothetical protein
VKYERERRLHEHEGRAARIAEVFSRTPAPPLWDMDRTAIETQRRVLRLECLHPTNVG